MRTKLPLYRSLYLIRRAEEKVVELVERGEINPLVHLSIGQEACAVGMCSALEPEDYIWSSHRPHAHYLAKGGNLYRFFAELAGKEDGCAHGWGGSMHLVDPDVNMMGSSAHVAGSVPLAVGAALASKLRGKKRISVSFLGDGATDQGIFWESLNFSIVKRLPVIFFCENNLYATHASILDRQPDAEIAKRVAAFGIKTFSVDGNDVEAVFKTAKKAETAARSGNPVFIEAKTYRYREHWGAGEDRHLNYRSKKEVEKWMAKCPVKMFRKKLLKKYPGKMISEMEKKVDLEIDAAWEKASKGKPATKINSKISEYSQSPEQSPEAVKVAKSERRLSYREAVAEAYLQAMENDSRVFLIGEGVDGISGIYGTTLPAYKKFGPSRVIDTPISDAAITGIAIGAAIVGMRPVIMHQRNDFMLVAMDQIVSHAAFWKYMTGGRLSVPVTIRSYVARKSGEAGQHTGSWQSLFGHVPGLKVVMPSSAYDAKGLTLAAIIDDDPVLIFENRVLNENEDTVLETLYGVPIGKAKIVRQGNDITIVAISAAVPDALKAAEILSQKGISAEVIDLRSIRPIDKETLLSSVRKTGKMVAVDTGFKTYGTGAELCALVAEELDSVRVRRIGMKEVPAPSAETLLAEGYHPDAKQIVEIVKKMFLN